MKNLELEKALYLERVGEVLTDIGFEHDPVKVEAKLFMVFSLTDRLYQPIHKTVCVLPKCNHSFNGRIWGVK